MEGFLWRVDALREVGVVHRLQAQRALQELLLGCHAASPADLPDLAMQAAATLGAEAMVMHVVDYAQTYLAPFAGDTTPHRDRLAVEGTLAGRAFAFGEISEGPSGSTTNGGHRLWVPMTDCGHRLGVLEVVTTDPLPPDERVTCEAIATVLAQLIATRRLYGDAIEHLRRGLPMQLATEIVWNLLPPLTFRTEASVVTGILEPCYEVGGDAFDYAVTDHVLHVALFDAVGHGIGASAMTTVAVNAYRNARRCGLDLLDTCRSVDKWIRARYPEQFVTAMLGELDLATGTLRSICAGHPGALLLRDGQMVKDLPAPTALPLGLCELSDEPPAIVEESLEPGDHLLFYTDGVVEARNEKGDFFGQQRLVDFVVRTLADRVPAPETLRRLVRAILDYQHERLQDDATAVLVQWPGRPARPGPLAARRIGYPQVMTDVHEPAASPPDVIDDQASDVLNEDEIVHVPPAVEQLVEAQEQHSTYPPEVPNWEPGEPPEAARP